MRVMRIAVMGAGGVGGYFGARLALAGNDVTFVARGSASRRDPPRRAAHRQRLRRRCMSTDANVTDDPASIGPVDAVMFCVKLWDVESAAHAIRPLLARWRRRRSRSRTASTRRRSSRASSGPTGSSAASPTSLPRSSRRERSGTSGTLARLRVGAFDGVRDDAAEAFVAAASGSGRGLRARTGHPTRAVGEVRLPVGAVGHHLPDAPAARRGSRGSADARHVRGDHARNVERRSRDRGRRWPRTSSTKQLAFAETLPSEMRASMLHDLVAGNRLEAPWLCGAVVRLGHESRRCDAGQRDRLRLAHAVLDGAH